MERTWNKSILYCNRDCTVFLVDIPASIEEAQRVRDSGTHSGSRKLYSILPLKRPYPSTEPKSVKALQKLQPLPDQLDLIALLQRLLEEIQQDFGGSSWCLPRSAWHPEALRTKSDKDERLRRSLAEQQNLTFSEPRSLPLSEVMSIRGLQNIQNQLVCNPHEQTLRLHIESEGSQYSVPPLSMFLVSDIDPSTSSAFSMAALQAFPEASFSTPAGPAQFDIIILDPPWPNRSVRRSGHFRAMDSGNVPVEALESVLGQHIAPAGLVCIWITNRAAVREHALNLMASWDSNLLEEWIWLKTTSIGEPVFDLEAVWRKPYETLLVGRRSSTGKAQSVRKDPVRRVIAAVPDLHSRKPNIKGLIDNLLMSPDKGYRTLEIFARNLATGVFSWGDEVLKYNDDQAWHDVLSDQLPETSDK